MKLLLDENLPKRLKADLQPYEVYTVVEKGWNGKKNGELLHLMTDEGFSALLTFDKNLQHQQNFQKYLITVFILSAKNNTYAELSLLVPQIHYHLKQEILPVGPVIICAATET